MSVQTLAVCMVLELETKQVIYWARFLAILKTTRDTRKWFHDFVAIFSVEAAYRNVADTLMEDYQPSGSFKA